MKYACGDIIQYKENLGFQRNLYGIVLEQLNKNCISIFSEGHLDSHPDGVQFFLGADGDSNYIKITKVVSSYKDIPKNSFVHQYTPQRLFIRELAKLNSASSDKKFLKSVSKVLKYIPK